MFESLRSTSDSQVLKNTDAIVAEDRKLTLRLLAHLHEIRTRKLYLTLGYASMFDYCTMHLRFSEPSAWRRLRTARCLAQFPALHTLLESGEVNLTSVSLISKILKPENSEALIARIRRKSKREVQRIAAEYEPRLALPPDSVRPVIVPVRQLDESSCGKFPVTGDGKNGPLLMEPSIAEDRRAGDPEKSPGATVSSSTTVELQRRAIVQFTAREEVIAKLERVRALASHRLRGGASMEDVIELLADEFIKREDPVARNERRKMRVQNSARSTRAGSARRISASVRDEVFTRDRQQCTYVSPGGKRCASTHVLQIDHIRPVARGGVSTIDNLRLLCAYHNRLEAERLMGKSGPAVT